MTQGHNTPPLTYMLPLANGGHVLIDLADFPLVAAHRWRCENGYATAKIKSRNVRLHALLLPAPEGMDVDHQNRDRLDCRRSNLRLATPSQNAANSAPRKNNKCGFKGVYQDESGRYRATITVNGKHAIIGHYLTADLAARAYDVVALEAFGEFAYLNFPEHLIAS